MGTRNRGTRLGSKNHGTRLGLKFSRTRFGNKNQSYIRVTLKAEADLLPNTENLRVYSNTRFGNKKIRWQIPPADFDVRHARPRPT